MSAQAAPPVLAAHRARVAALQDAMAQLHGMHEEAHDLWCRIVHVRASDAADRQQQLDALHDEVYAHADRIANVHEATFGRLSRETRLMLTGTVESAHPSLIRPELSPLATE